MSTKSMSKALSEIDMEPLAREVIEELLSFVPNGKLQVEIEHIPAAKDDCAMMRQVFVNRLPHAIKFSRNSEPPKIEVGAEVKGGEAATFSFSLPQSSTNKAAGENR